MHLPRDQVQPAVRGLVSLLRPGGTLALSWRVVESDHRIDGRLYTAFEAGVVTEALASMAVLFQEDATSESSGERLIRLIARAEQE